jgi:tRNA threonylcarbamoyladenosine biosynthesis protein TsaE
MSPKKKQTSRKTAIVPQKEQVVLSGLEMKSLGAAVALSLLAQPVPSSARVIALHGDLGAGKTTFAQGFLSSLGVRSRVISPTFLLMRPYAIKGGSYQRVVHIDCYRLHKKEELLSLGLQQLLASTDTILLIEWPELIADLLPDETMHVYIEHPLKGSSRLVRIV